MYNQNNSAIGYVAQKLSEIQKNPAKRICAKSLSLPIESLVLGKPSGGDEFRAIDAVGIGFRLGN